MSNKKLIGIISFLFLCLPYQQVQAQALSAKNFQAPTILKEELRVITDRDTYLAGEDILFSAMATTNDWQDPAVSNVLYVELYKSDYSTLSRLKFQMVEGQVSGAFPIPKVILSDHYYLRAYTQYMRNFPAEIFFNKRITILNPEIPSQNNEPKMATVKLWPENGHLISGINSKIVLQVDERLVKDMDHFLISNTEGDIHIKDQCLDNGLAQFELTPNDSLDYEVKLIMNNGDSLVKAFPETTPDGIALSIEEKEYDYIIAIHTHEEAYKNTTVRLQWLLADLCPQYEVPLHLTDGNSQISIAKKWMQQGLNYLVLRDASDEIIYVRPVYHLANKKQAHIRLADRQLSSRTKVSIDLKDWGDHTVLRVVKSGTVSDERQLLPNYVIHNPFLLDSYLSSSSSIDETVIKQVDQSLILNWAMFNTSRFKNKIKTACKDDLQWLPETRDVSLSGVVRQKTSHLPVPNAMVFASVLGDVHQIHSYQTGEDGQFYFSLNQLSDFKDVCICSDLEDDNVEVLVYNDYAVDFANINHLPLQIDSTMIALVEQMWVNQQTGKVFAEKTELEYIQPDSLAFAFSNPRISIALSDYIALPNLYEVFNEIIPFVDARKKKDHYYLSVLSDNKLLAYERPLILVDNLPVFDIDQLMDIHPSKIERINVYNTNYTYGDLVIRGLILIKTNTENFGGLEAPINSVFLEFQTLSPNIELTFPDYSKSTDKLPDFRNLLYWNPSASADHTGQQIEFYTGDRRGPYELIINGYDQEGNKKTARQLINIQ